MNLTATDFWTAANAITALIVGVIAAVVAVALHRRSRHRELTIILDRVKSVFSEVSLGNSDLKLKINDKEVDRLSVQKVQVGNTGANSINDVKVKVRSPFRAGFFLIAVDEDGLNPSRLSYGNDDGFPCGELFFEFLNPREVCVVSVLFDGEAGDCEVVHRQPDVKSKIVRQRAPGEILETSFGIAATYATGGASAALMTIVKALAR